MHDVLVQMAADRIVPVFHDDDADVAVAVAVACIEAGLSTFEFTKRSPKALEVLSEVVRRVGSQIVVGVGSITDARQATEALDAGAAFVVGPSVDHGVGEVCGSRGVAYIPGGSTLTELIEGTRIGSGLVKLFPAAHVGGPEYLSALRAPCPWLEVMPTGGIEPSAQSIGPWFEAGAVCVGLGSSLFPRALIDEQQWDELASSVADAVAVVAQLR